MTRLRLVLSKRKGKVISELGDEAEVGRVNALKGLISEVDLWCAEERNDDEIVQKLRRAGGDLPEN